MWDNRTYPEEIATKLVYLADHPKSEIENVEHALSFLRTTALNSYNSEYFRTIYDVLVDAVEHLTEMGICHDSRMNKVEWLESKCGHGFFSGVPECIDFYYKAMHDNGMDYADADRYAWLNTLVGYDIGADYARKIDRWMYENGQEVLELTAAMRETFETICEFELGIKLDYSRWATKEPRAFKYF